MTDTLISTEIRGPARINPADRAQLAESPVTMRRVAGLFSGHTLALSGVTAIIVVASVVGLAQPFLLREVIDVALPTGDTTLLVWLVAGMVAVAAVTGILGVWQTWLATTIGQRVAFAEAAQTGRLVSETDGGERAAHEVTALVAEIDSLGIGRIVR